MPLIKIDYNDNLLGEEEMNTLVGGVLSESMLIYNTTEDKVSIFTSSFSKHFFSTAAAEIEVRAKLSEYDKSDKSRDELRQEHLAEYSKYLKNFISEHKLSKGIVFTITFEDWQVVWLPGIKD